MIRNITYFILKLFFTYIFLLIIAFILIATQKINLAIIFLLILLLFIIIYSFYGSFTAPYVPTINKRITTMVEIINPVEGMTIVDLGAGDGLIVSEMAKRGANSYGYELSLPLIALFYLKKIFGMAEGNVYFGDIWKQDYSEANVLVIYLLPKPMQTFLLKIYPHLRENTLIVSNYFEIKGLKPEKVVNDIYFYKKR